MVGPTCNANLSPKRSYSNTFFKPEEFENVGLSVLCGYDHVISLFESVFKHKFRMAGDFCVFTFLLRFVDAPFKFWEVYITHTQTRIIARAKEAYNSRSLVEILVHTQWRIRCSGTGQTHRSPQ